MRPLWQAGYRGFFLDTLDSYQLAAKDDAARARQEAGLVRVIGEIKRSFPEAKLIFNRGFEILPDLHALAYAVAAESLFQGWDPGEKRYRDVPEADRAWLLGQLRRVRAEYRLPVLAIDYVAPEDRDSRAPRPEKSKRSVSSPGSPTPASTCSASAPSRSCRARS